MSHAFKPSKYSYAGHARQNITLRFPLGFCCTTPIKVLQTKTEQYAFATGKEAKEWAQYQRCRGKEAKKGRIPYPDDPASKKCDQKYNSWKKWVRKLGERAGALEQKRLSQMKLTPEQEKRLGKAQEKASLAAMDDEMRDRELKRRRKKRRAKAVRRAKKKGEITPDEGILMTEDQLLEEAALEGESGETSDTTLFIIGGLGGFALLTMGGGLLYYLLRR